MFRFTLLFALCFILAVPTAVAASTNKAGAERLKTLFSTYIENHKTTIENRGGTLKTDGDIVVEQADEYYAITLPAITITKSDGAVGEIGLIAINATPTDNPDNWTMSIAIPTPILYKDKEGNPTMRLDIGAQEMGGIWNGALQNFSRLSARYSDIKLSHFKEQHTLSIGQLNIGTDLIEGEKNHWSGPIKTKLKNITLTKGEKGELLTLKEAGLSINLENFLVNKKDIDLENAPKNNTNKNNTDFSLRLHYSDLNTQGVQNNQNDIFLPDRLALNLVLNSFPLDGLISFTENFLSTTQNNSTSKQVAALQAMITLPKLLSDAGTTLTMTDTNYGNDLYHVNLNGAVKANPASIFGTTGELVFSIEDIDKTLKKLEEKGEQQKNIKKVKLIRELCHDKNESKPSQTICRITLDEDAKLSVNDQDLNLLLKALAGEERTVQRNKAKNIIEDTTAKH